MIRTTNRSRRGMGVTMGRARRLLLVGFAWVTPLCSARVENAPRGGSARRGNVAEAAGTAARGGRRERSGEGGVSRGVARKRRGRRGLSDDDAEDDEAVVAALRAEEEAAKAKGGR